MRRLWLVPLVFVGLLEGCTVGPKYVRPDVNTPAVFRGVEPGAHPNANSFGDIKWFELFKDDQLQSLIRKAVVQNYDVRDAVAREFEARANLGISRSNQFPQIGAAASLTSTQLSTKGQFVLPPTLPPGFFLSRTRNF